MAEAMHCLFCLVFFFISLLFWNSYRAFWVLLCHVLEKRENNIFTLFTCKYTTVCCLLCFPTNIANILMSYLLPMILLWCLGVVSSAQTLPRNFARTSSTPSELSNRVSAEVPKRTSLNKVLSWVQFTLTMSLSFSLPISSSDEMQLDRLMKSLQAFGFVENEKNSLLTIF